MVRAHRERNHRQRARVAHRRHRPGGRGERKATKEAIDAVRAELTEAIAARPAEVEIAARLAHIKSVGLEHLDRCLARMAKADAALGLSCADIGLLPN
jgi:hypothetical protein